MKCRRAFDADLLAVLRGEGGDLEFLGHYPTCPECAAELRVWSELDQLLRAGVPAEGSHPTEESLLAFVDAPATLRVAAREEVERHLAACRTCADEVGSLRCFDPVRLTAATDEVDRMVPPGSAPATPPPGGWLGPLVRHPAFAYALVLALLVPALWNQLDRFAMPARVEKSVREERAQVPVAGRFEPAPPAPPAEPASRVARVDAPAVAAPVAKVAMEPRSEADAGPRQVPAQNERYRSASEDEDAVMADAPALARKSARHDAMPNRRALTGGIDDLRGALHQGAAPMARPSISVRPDSATVIPADVAASGPRLRIAAPASLGDSVVDVRVRALVGGRELAERLARHANAIELQIPPRWLAPGDYTITLAPADGDPDEATATAPGTTAPGATAPVRLGFSVSAPSTANPRR